MEQKNYPDDQMDQTVQVIFFLSNETATAQMIKMKSSFL